MIKRIVIELDNDRTIVLNPNKGVDLVYTNTIYPLELKLILTLMDILIEYKDNFSK